MENYPKNKDGLENVLNHNVGSHEVRELVKYPGAKHGCNVNCEVLQQEDH